MKRNVRYWANSMLLAMAALLCTTACSSDAIVGNKYASIPARFTYSPVSAISQLYAACEAMNEWCTITAERDRFVFTNLGGSTPVNRTAQNYYTGISMGVCGFIVGRPPIFEIGYDNSSVVCYDLGCSNCYNLSGQRKALTLKSGGRAYCATCQRTYDLNNMGIVSNGNRGNTLFRYRVTYSNNTLVINNY